MTEIHQKSEGCWCGASINAEGSEQDVVLACKNFRLYHSHREPLKIAITEVSQRLKEVLERLGRRMEYNSHDLGEFGNVVKLDYVKSFIDAEIKTL